MTNVAANLTETAARVPQARALILDSTVLSYADFDAASARVAGYLRWQGLQPGDRVGLLLPNVPAFAVLYYGILRMGGIVVPMSPQFTFREIAYHLRDSGTAVLFAMPGDGPAAAIEVGTTCITVDGTDMIDLAGIVQSVTEYSTVVERDDNDTAVILYTSGTTARPRGAELTHHNLHANLVSTAETLLNLTDQDVVMGCLSLFHVLGMTCGLNAAVYVGASLTLVPRFDANKVLEVIIRDKVTVCQGIPADYATLLQAAVDRDVHLRTLRLAISGGAPMPGETLREFENRFGSPILEGYGLAETAGVASITHSEDERKPGTIGTPIRGCDITLVDRDGHEVPPGEPGEIVISGEIVMARYWKNPTETARVLRNGRLHTGDLATRDEQGHLTIVDRIADTILRGGLNVYPREIERVLFEHPAVAEAAVIGLPHESLGEEIVAYVVLKRGASADPGALSTFVQDRVERSPYPSRVHILPSLPKTVTGKILKRELRQ